MGVFQFSLLAHIRRRMVKLGMCIGNSWLDIHTKLGGDWVWPSGYYSRSIPPYLLPSFGVRGHGSLPYQIMNSGVHS